MKKQIKKILTSLVACVSLMGNVHATVSEKNNRWALPGMDEGKNQWNERVGQYVKGLGFSIQYRVSEDTTCAGVDQPVEHYYRGWEDFLTIPSKEVIVAYNPTCTEKMSDKVWAFVLMHEFAHHVMQHNEKTLWVYSKKTNIKNITPFIAYQAYMNDPLVMMGLNTTIDFESQADLKALELLLDMDPYFKLSKQDIDSLFARDQMIDKKNQERVDFLDFFFNGFSTKYVNWFIPVKK